MRILLAEDNPAFLKALERFLRADPRIRELHLARSGAEAIELAEREKPDLVLLDWALPDLKGLWAALRISGEADTTAVWLLAPDDKPEYEQAARAAGAEGCLSRRHFLEKIGPILQNLQQRTGRRSRPPGGPAPEIMAGFAPHQLKPDMAGKNRDAELPVRNPLGESSRPMTVLQAIQDLERFCSQHLDGLAKIRADLAASPESSETTNRRSGELHLVCRLGMEYIGLATGQVARVEKTTAIFPLAPEYAPVRGLAPFAGSAVPVLSFSESGAAAEAARLVILRSGRSLVGLQIDGIEDMIAVATSDQCPFPWHPNAGPRSYLTRVTRYKDRFIFLVDVDKIMADLNGALKPR